ncbi:MAG: hypothetical protein ABH851_02645 [Methanobacteriota archaeon]
MVLGFKSGGDMPKTVFVFIVVLFFGVTYLLVEYLFQGFYVEVTSAMLFSWFFLLILHGVPEDKNALEQIVKPFILVFTLSSGATLLAVIIVGGYELAVFIVHVMGRYFEVIEMIIEEIKYLNLF